jgi:hypothetical protein
MPAIVRKNADKHVGHASPTPNPFHQTAYAEGSSNVFVNGATVRQTLLDQLFVFNEELTEAEKNLFNYIEDTYIENNPGDVNSVFSSYVGVYFNDEGQST